MHTISRDVTKAPVGVHNYGCCRVHFGGLGGASTGTEILTSVPSASFTSSNGLNTPFSYRARIIIAAACSSPILSGALAPIPVSTIVRSVILSCVAMRKQRRSAMIASIHETAEGLHAAGVMDKRTMREFDELCLTPVRPLKPKEIRALRLREGASQAVFARYLNVTTGLVSQWERGERRPQGASLKLLSLVAKNGLQTVA
jgi:putative transcriptional regulator